MSSFVACYSLFDYNYDYTPWLSIPVDCNKSQQQSQCHVKMLTYSDPAVLHDFINGKSLIGVCLQKATDEIFGCNKHNTSLC